MSDIIERTNKSFSDFLSSNQGKNNPKSYNRYIGGHNSTLGPHISGYWYLLIKLPIFEMRLGTNQITSENLFTTNEEERLSIVKFLHGTAHTFSPPSKTIQKGELSGFGGVKKFIILNQNVTSNFSVTFTELSGLPIKKIFKIWTSMFNSTYGFSQSKIYKGQLYAFLCKPTVSLNGQKIKVEDVEELFYFEGVFPESDGSDALTSDISSNGIVTYNINFSFDSYYFGNEYFNILEEGIRELGDTLSNLIPNNPFEGE